MRIIGLTGRAGAGKDTVADIIQSVAIVQRFAFADLLRFEAADAWGIDPRLFQCRDLRETPLEQLALRRCTDPAFVHFAWELSTFGPLKPRTVMQRWGDFRRAADEHYFLISASSMLGLAHERGADALLATDVRYPNEARWITLRGGVLWRVHRPGLAPIGSHSSEVALSDVEPDATIVNDNSIDDLRRRVVDLLGQTLGTDAIATAQRLTL